MKQNQPQIAPKARTSCLKLAFITISTLFIWLIYLGHQLGYYEQLAGFALTNGSIVLTFLSFAWFESKKDPHSFPAKTPTENQGQAIPNSQLSEAQAIAHIGSWDWDLKTNIIAWSDELFKISGFTPGTFDPSFNKFLEVVHPDDRAAIQLTVQKAIETKQDFFSTIRMVRPTGEVRYIASRGRSLLDSDKNPFRMVGTAQDITEKHLLEEQLADQQKLVIQTSKMTALGEMASGIAHEINNPLGIISSLASDIRDLYEFGNFEQEKVLDVIGKIEKTVERAAKIINGLRAFARDSSGAKFQMTQVSQILDDTLAFCSEKLKNNGIELTLPDSNHRFSIECQPIQISQVLLNLLNNATDAVQSNPEKWIKIETKDVNSGIEISITDSGKGIPFEVREKLFNPFFTTKDIGKGTGLGLSISKGIIAKHGGTITVDSTSPNTRFQIVLPKKQPVEQTL